MIKVKFSDSEAGNEEIQVPDENKPEETDQNPKVAQELNSEPGPAAAQKYLFVNTKKEHFSRLRCKELDAPGFEPEGTENKETKEYIRADEDPIRNEGINDLDPNAEKTIERIIVHRGFNYWRNFLNKYACNKNHVAYISEKGTSESQEFAPLEKL